MLGFLIAILSGALMSIQGVFNTEVTKNSSMWSANAFVQLTAFMKVFSVQPKYMLLGGVIGAFITYTVIVSINQLGPAKSAMFIVIAQLIVSYAIELMGIWGMEKQPFSLRKAAGMLIAVAGIAIFKWETQQ